MAQFTIRNIEDEVKVRLQQRARRNGTSLEAEVREILRVAVNDDREPGHGVGSRIAARFAKIGLDQPIAELHAPVEAPKLSR